MNTTEHQKFRLTMRSIIVGMTMVDKRYAITLAAFDYAEKNHTGLRKDGVTPEFNHQLNIFGFMITQIKNMKKHGLFSPSSCFMTLWKIMVTWKMKSTSSSKKLSSMSIAFPKCAVGKNSLTMNTTRQWLCAAYARLQRLLTVSTTWQPWLALCPPPSLKNPSKKQRRSSCRWLKRPRRTFQNKQQSTNCWNHQSTFSWPIFVNMSSCRKNTKKLNNPSNKQ